MTPHEFAQALSEKFSGDEFEFATRNFTVDNVGPKYIRIAQHADDDMGGEERKSVHCFLDHDGHVYKAAGWKAPAKGIRYTTPEEALAAADVYGRYLYAR